MLVLDAPIRRITSLGFTPDGLLWVAFEDDSYDAAGAGWFDLRTGKAEHVERVLNASCLSFAPDGSGFAFRVPFETSRRTCQLWWYDRPDARHARVFESDDFWGHDLTAAPGGAAVALQVIDTNRRPDEMTAVRVWQAPDRLGPPLAPEFRPRRPLTFSPDGRRLAVGTYRDLLVIWDLDTDTVGRVVRVRASVAAWPRADLLVTAGHGTVAVWNPLGSVDQPALQTADLVADLLSLAVSADGRVVAAGFADGVVRAWDIATGQPAAAWDWNVGPVRCLAFAPDGLTAVAAGDGGKVVAWDLDW